jgi:hypothetical protein
VCGGTLPGCRGQAAVRLTAGPHLAVTRYGWHGYGRQGGRQAGAVRGVHGCGSTVGAGWPLVTQLLGLHGLGGERGALAVAPAAALEALGEAPRPRQPQNSELGPRQLFVQTARFSRPSHPPSSAPSAPTPLAARPAAGSTCCFHRGGTALNQQGGLYTCNILYIHIYTPTPGLL